MGGKPTALLFFVGKGSESKKVNVAKKNLRKRKLTHTIVAGNPITEGSRKKSGTFFWLVGEKEANLRQARAAQSKTPGKIQPTAKAVAGVKNNGETELSRRGGRGDRRVGKKSAEGIKGSKGVLKIVGVRGMEATGEKKQLIKSSLKGKKRTGKGGKGRTSGQRRRFRTQVKPHRGRGVGAGATNGIRRTLGKKKNGEWNRSQALQSKHRGGKKGQQGGGCQPPKVVKKTADFKPRKKESGTNPHLETGGKSGVKIHHSKHLAFIRKGERV